MIGTLSTVAFVPAVAYATFIHRLFDLRVALRETSPVDISAQGQQPRDFGGLTLPASLD